MAVNFIPGSSDEYSRGAVLIGPRGGPTQQYSLPGSPGDPGGKLERLLTPPKNPDGSYAFPGIGQDIGRNRQRVREVSSGEVSE
jgi:hypothetical protein